MCSRSQESGAIHLLRSFRSPSHLPKQLVMDLLQYQETKRTLLNLPPTTFIVPPRPAHKNTNQADVAVHHFPSISSELHLKPAYSIIRSLDWAHTTVLWYLNCCSFEQAPRQVQASDKATPRHFLTACNSLD